MWTLCHICATHGYWNSNALAVCPLCELDSQGRGDRNRRASARAKREGISLVQALKLENREIVARAFRKPN